ncbi:MAG: TCP-1/cpn60 chaperonin family protein [Archaeoglobaceae archaeon]|nr:TCP-1/cpn60 chaperonin family protein [Archaeoglobaceae archaeon]MCX8151708.1 TCP-1/cpn60 chaperonin family protein [Archaeoglobaceae archaeon]MDW8013014.1 thermosome subunit beta [Archaeoglobaceae archaeon]
MATLQGVPVLILKEGTQRTVGRDAQRMNIMAARIIAEAVKTTLGPKGMDKMLVDSLGDVVITNDGVTILKEMDVEHPAAKMVVEIAKTQENEVGDGTTTAVVLAGELLKEAQKLLDQNFHPTTIAKGYRLAAAKAMEILDNFAITINVEDVETLKKVAATAITGKHAEMAADRLAQIVVDAVKKVAEKRPDNTYKVDEDNIKLEKRHGGSVADTQLVDGIVVDKEVVHPAMPKRIKNAKIAVLKASLEVKETEIDAEIRITDPDQIKKFIEQEEKMIKDMVDKIAKVGANVVFCQKGIDDLAQYYLAKAGILAVRRVKQSDIEKIAKATGAKILTDLRDIKPEDLGTAEIVEERKVGDEKMVFVMGCKNPKAVTILIRGGSEHVVDEVERSLTDAIKVTKAAVENGKIVAGGGAPEIEVSLRLKQWAPSLGGREQIAIEAFANALEVIPRALSENAGLDPIDILVNLRKAHEEGKTTYGVDVFSGKVTCMKEKNVLEPLKVKKQAISSATEVAIMILRIDDVIAAKGLEKESKAGGEEKKEEEEEETTESD